MIGEKKMNSRVEINQYGFYNLIDKPPETEMAEYYSKKYYQNERSVYQKNYGPDEIKYFINKIEQKYTILENYVDDKEKKTLLDIGCGEGFTLNYFLKKEWEITGIDYSNEACLAHNPECSNFIISGNFFETFSDLKNKNKTFDLIWLDNVLEHVLNPFELLKNCHELASEDGILVIEVPNDFSIIQRKLKEMNLIEEDYWIAIPDHISYFNKQGLINVCLAAQWKNLEILADFPIDFNLFHPDANYISDKQTGKGAHLQRILLENIFHEISVKKTNSLYRIFAEMGLGRQIIGVFKKV